MLLSKSPPASGSSLYTKGFPRCQKHNGTDITQAATLNNGVLLWLPDAIGGQSGSGVWSDADNLQRALLTWSMTRGGRRYGAGQLTAEIYKQNRAGELRGFAQMPGLVELPHEFEFDGVDRSGLGDPIVQEGFFSVPMERGIQDFPIWAEDVVVPPVDPGDDSDTKRLAINALRRVRDLADDEIRSFEAGISLPIDPANPGSMGPTFGL